MCKKGLHLSTRPDVVTLPSCVMQALSSRVLEVVDLKPKPKTLHLALLQALRVDHPAGRQHLGSAQTLSPPLTHLAALQALRVCRPDRLQDLGIYHHLGLPIRFLSIWISSNYKRTKRTWQRSKPCGYAARMPSSIWA